jgi:hypothetical protein
VSGRAPVPGADPVEARLRAAAAAATWPPTPDLRERVLAGIAAATPDLRAPVVARIDGTRPLDIEPPRPWRRRGPVLRALAVAVAAVLLLAGVATALGYRLPGLDIVFVPSLPPAGGGLDLGSPVPLADAQSGGGPLRLPAALPAPATAWVAGSGAQRIVTVAWRADPGRPTLDDSDLSLLLMEVPGRAEGAYLTKALGPGTTIEPVTVGGDQGWWIAGPAHELLFQQPDGNVGVLDARLAGDTLVFSRDGTLYRFESALGKDATVAIAESLR